MTEKNFWALNSIVVEPAYVAFREGLRQLAERLFAKNDDDATRAKLRAVHTLAIGGDGELNLLKPERIVVKGETAGASAPA